ncbi:MAG: hypothetical protein FVQ81_00840 [Candidatus Glassbacteria bacterium]|nr:hypothetical protein [Candidatus Glassbacteria bacterium]
MIGNSRLSRIAISILTALQLAALPLAAEIIIDEGFESGALGDNWERYKNDPERGDFESRPEHVHSGKKSYRITTYAVTGETRLIRGHEYKESDSWLRAWFLPGYDTTYIRWYVKFARDFDQGRGMHWCQFWGCRPDNPQSVLGGAGRRPTGEDRFITTLDLKPMPDTDPPGQVAFYTYWPEMKQAPDGYYWGNFFYPDTPVIIERDKWYCFEVMVKTNRPGEKDGEQAAWVNGEKIMHITGMRWRDVESLKLNMAMFGCYIGYCEHDCTYWIDDVVISTGYVGPLR